MKSQQIPMQSKLICIGCIIVAQEKYQSSHSFASTTFPDFSEEVS